MKKINAIPNRMEEKINCMLRKNLIFIDGMWFMDSSLENLVKNLPKNKFKYFFQEL